MNIQGLILKVRQLLSGKASPVARRNVGYDDAKKIGLLIYNPDPSFNQILNTYVKTLQNEGKTIECLCFNSKKNNYFYNFPCSYFTIKSLDWKGDFKEERINKFIKTEFDYLYSINNLPFLPFKIILQKSRAKCRVGKYEKGLDLDIMIDPGKEQSLKALLEQMVIYSKKIKIE